MSPNTRKFKLSTYNSITVYYILKLYIKYYFMVDTLKLSQIKALYKIKTNVTNEISRRNYNFVLSLCITSTRIVTFNC